MPTAKPADIGAISRTLIELAHLIADVPEIVSELIDQPDEHLTNLGSKGIGEPPIIPTRRWPSSSRWRVAVSPPFQLVAPIDGVSWSGSPVGSTTTSTSGDARSAASSRSRYSCVSISPRASLASSCSRADGSRP